MTKFRSRLGASCLKRQTVSFGEKMGPIGKLGSPPDASNREIVQPLKELNEVLATSHVKEGKLASEDQSSAKKHAQTSAKKPSRCRKNGSTEGKGAQKSKKVSFHVTEFTAEHPKPRENHSQGEGKAPAKRKQEEKEEEQSNQDPQRHRKSPIKRQGSQSKPFHPTSISDVNNMLPYYQIREPRKPASPTKGILKKDKSDKTTELQAKKEENATLGCQTVAQQMAPSELPVVGANNASQAETQVQLSEINEIEDSVQKMQNA